MNPGVHGAIAAAQAAEKKKLEEEEERMTRYNSDELDQDWEFKIVRSNTAIFGKPEVLQRITEEEAISGWQMLEKLDNNRVRFKRPAKARSRDMMLPEGIDPYRTQIGGSGAAVVFVVMGVVLMVGLGVAALVMVEEGGADFGEIPLVAVALVAGIVAVIGGVVAAMRSNR